MMHDHKVKTKPMYCPLLGEICTEGWTPKMGEDDKHVRPRCSKWVGVFVNNKEKNQIEEVFDCNEQWIPELIQQVAEETYQGAAATEQVRNHVAGQAHTFKTMGLAFQGMARKSGVTLQDIQAIDKEQQALLGARNDTEEGKK
jgi:hypothetical protein